MDRAFKFSLEHDTQQNKKENGIPLVVTYNPIGRDLSTNSSHALIFFSQMQRSQRFLRHVHLLRIEILEIFRVFGEDKSLH